MATPPEPFSVTVEHGNGRCLIRPRGELDLATVPELDGAVGGGISAGKDVVIDLRGLDFLDSTGLRSLLQADAAAAAAGVRLAIVPPEPGSEVIRVLEVAGVLQTFDVADV